MEELYEELEKQLDYLEEGYTGFSDLGRWLYEKSSEILNALSIK